MKILLFLQIYFIKLLFPKYYMLPTALVYAQASHETGNFKSSIFKINKNLFGMKLPKIRKTTANGSKSGHATYSSHYNSIYDYFLRQESFNITYKNLHDYVEQTFSSNYAEDKLYRSKWLAHYFSLGYIRYITYIFIPTIILVFYYFVNDEEFEKKWQNLIKN